MSSPAKPHDGDPFHAMAHDVFRVLDKGSGTLHARIRLIRDVLAEMAAANQTDGYQKGLAVGYANGVRDATPKDVVGAVVTVPGAEALPAPAAEITHADGIPIDTARLDWIDAGPRALNLQRMEGVLARVNGSSETLRQAIDVLMGTAS